MSTDYIWRILCIKNIKLDYTHFNLLSKCPSKNIPNNVCNIGSRKTPHTCKSKLESTLESLTITNQPY